MPLTEEVKALFNSTDDNVKKVLAEIAPKIEEAFNASEQEFIRNKSKVNQEAQALRKHKIALERLARENGVEKIDDPETFVNDFSTKFKGTSEKTSTIEQQLKIIQQQLADQKNETIAAKKKGLEASVKSKASSDFNKYLFASGLHLNQAIAQGLTLADDGETLLWKDGDEFVDYSKGLAKYVSEHKDDARNLSQTGAGSSGNKKKSGSSKQEATLTQSEFDAMEPQERAKFAKANPGWSISG